MGFTALREYDIARRHDGKKGEAVSCCDHALARANESRALAIAASGSGRPAHRNAEERLDETTDLRSFGETGNPELQLAVLSWVPRLRGDERKAQLSSGELGGIIAHARINQRGRRHGLRHDAGLDEQFLHPIDTVNRNSQRRINLLFADRLVVDELR